MPIYRPDPLTGIENMEQLIEYLQREQQKIADAVNNTLDSTVTFLNVQPKKKEQGMIVGADGVNWNPGSGRGLYAWVDGGWRFLGGSGVSTPPTTITPTPTPSIPPDPTPTPTPSNLPAAGYSIATFHSIGIYWTPPSLPTQMPNGERYAVLEFKKASVGTWSRAQDMWYDARNNECRGSIVHCTPNTKYDVRMSLSLGTPLSQISAQTWSETFPEDPQVTLPGAGNASIRITQSGTETAYRVYDGGEALALRDAQDSTSWNFYVDADYIIIRRFKLAGASIDAIRIAPQRHHIVVENCEISNFGRGSSEVTDEGWGIRANNEDCGIKVGATNDADLPSGSAGGNHHIVIQRNKVYDPRYSANSWSTYHPTGCVGIFMFEASGPNVIRYNEVYSTHADGSHWYMDGIGGGENIGQLGSPGRDSDVYGNLVTNCWDDAIESEGGGMNVRIWNNYCSNTNVAIATSVCHLGPIYVFRNVQNRSRARPMSSWDDDDRNEAFKSRDIGGWGGGARYFFHNTLLQEPGGNVGAIWTLGGGAGISGAAGEPMTHTMSRNNIFETFNRNNNPYPSILVSTGDDVERRGNDFDYDLCYGGVFAYTGAEPNAVKRLRAIYVAGHGWPSQSNFQLAPTSPGKNVGVVLANFNDVNSPWNNATPDMGAHEDLTAPMQFGITSNAS